jgi:Ni,Fe-hydrogenase III small subunit
MPDPKIVIAVGTDAVSGGLLGAAATTGGVAATTTTTTTTTSGVGAAVPVDIWLAGSPPSPFGILNALLIAVGMLPGGRKKAR